MCYFVPNFLILVQPTSKVVFNALKSVTIPVLISYILLSDDVGGGIEPSPFTMWLIEFIWE